MERVTKQPFESGSTAAALRATVAAVVQDQSGLAREQWSEEVALVVLAMRDTQLEMDS
jgi:hypothetical protein